MRIFVSILIILTTILNLKAQSPSFKTFMNPVIPGDHPDCTVTKVGNDFYTTGSSFNVTPVIYHSTDLVHWEAIAQPVTASWTNYGDSPGGGCWGGQVVFYNGKWWHYFSRGNTMHYTKADNVEGPWGTPVKVNNPSSLPYGLGYDNSLFIDDDNIWYLVVKNGKPNGGIVELGDNGQATGIVYNLNWLNPDPTFPYSWAEGPVMWKYDGYYYYSFARDLGGGQRSMRSKTLTADKSAWEMMGDFFNENDPKKSGSLFSAPNHASQVVMINDSTSWIVHPIYAKDDWRGQGRQGLMNQVRYSQSGKPMADYPTNQSFTAPKLPSSGIPWMVPKSDFFDSNKLHPEWSFVGYSPASKISLNERPGWLRLSPKSTVKANTVVKNDGEHNYSLITRIDFQPNSKNDAAGLQIMRGDETKFVRLLSTIDDAGKDVIAFSFESSKYEIENTVGDTLWLKIIRVNHSITGYYSSNGKEWIQVGNAIDISSVDSFSDYSTFTGTRQGLYVQGAKNAFFDLYIYRDAFTPILAECPANQYGTSKTLAGSGISILDNIHNNDWALYAGVEFGDGTYYDLPDSVEFTASCGSAGGTIEVWLDSIDAGEKIAECIIGTSGSLVTYKSFKAPVSNVSGIHDVYLRFVGPGTSSLFRLKWMTFTSKSAIPDASRKLKQMGKIELYPNPTKSRLSIRSPFEFNTTEIFSLNGQRVFQKKNEKSETIQLDLNLDNGMYLVKVTGNTEMAFSRLMIEL